MHSIGLYISVVSVQKTRSFFRFPLLFLFNLLALRRKKLFDDSSSLPRMLISDTQAISKVRTAVPGGSLPSAICRFFRLPAHSARKRNSIPKTCPFPSRYRTARSFIGRYSREEKCSKKGVLAPPWVDHRELLPRYCFLVGASA